MAEKKVEFEIAITGNASEKIKLIVGQTEKLNTATKKVKASFSEMGKGFVILNQTLDFFKKLSSEVQAFTEAYNAQIEAETKLAKVMRNTMGAAQAQVDSIKALTAAQQKLGVIGDEVQLAGAQELATYLSKTESLKTLIPVMNDMLAQQYGLNASQEQATQIASMLGKVMDGQVGALSRYGYKFDKAQEKILKFGTAEQATTKFEKLGDFSLRLNNIYAPAEVVISNTASPRCPAKRTYSSRPRWAATWCWAPK